MLLISFVLLFALIYRSAVADGAQRLHYSKKAKPRFLSPGANSTDRAVYKWLHSGTTLKTDWLTRWPCE
jgi:hypothetical protein